MHILPVGRPMMDQAGRFDGFFDYLGPSWVHLVAILDHLGASWGHLGAQVDPKMAPRWLQDGPKVVPDSLKRAIESIKNSKENQYFECRTRHDGP